MIEKIFKAYDIRGVYPEEINEDAAYLIGRAFAVFTGAKSVVVGRDMRTSSPSLFEALSRGITDQGSDVVDIGMVMTPMLSYAVMSSGREAGIMISASHNPSQYNAFKLIRNGGEGALQIHDGNGIKEIQALAEENKFAQPSAKGKIIQEDIKEKYQTAILEEAGGVNGLKIVCDYGNGAGSIGAKGVFEKLSIEALHFFDEPDGTFPNHVPNPQEIENLDFLREKVVAEKADLGLFFDGDADRCVLVDEQGAIIFPDVMLGILAEAELEKNPGGKVFYDLRFTKAVAEEISAHGGEPIMLRVGNPFYKEALRDKKGLLAGELSGHIMYKKFFSIDDGLYSAVQFMKILTQIKKKASELAKPFQKYFQTEEINMEVPDANAVMEKVKEKYTDGELIMIDGIRIDYPDWWLSLRKSNTEPIVRLRLEAKSADLLQKKRDEVLGIIKG